MPEEGNPRVYLVGGPSDHEMGSLGAIMVGRHRPAYICTRTGREWHHYDASSEPGRYLYLGPCLEVDHPQGWPHDHELDDPGRGPDSKGMSRGR